MSWLLMSFQVARRADGSEMIDFAPDGRERRARCLERRDGAADKERQLAGFRGLTAAADRRVEKTAAFGLNVARQFPHPGGRECTRFHDDRARPRPAERAVVAKPDFARGRASATIAKTKSAPSAASRGVAATLAPLSDSGCALARVQFQTFRLKRLASQLAAMQDRIVPRPRSAMRCQWKICSDFYRSSPESRGSDRNPRQAEARGREGFTRVAALEATPGVRLNVVVFPGWVKETMVKFGLDPTPGKA